MTDELKPTSSHILWGGAVEIHCFGKATGNWSLAGSSPVEAEQKNPIIMNKMLQLMFKFGCTIYAPNPSEFNAVITDKNEFRDIWFDDYGVALYRGPKADGVVLSEPNTAFAVSSGDCPTVVLFDETSGALIGAHAGRDSLLRYINPRAARPRNHSVVDSMWDAMVTMVGKRDDNGMRSIDSTRLKAATVCGISGNHFSHPLDDPTYGEHNRLLQLVALAYGKNDVAFEDDDMGAIHLPSLIKSQHRMNGLRDSDIMYDGVCTFSNKGRDGEHLWHSHRRGDKTRNLVLVIRR